LNNFDNFDNLYKFDLIFFLYYISDVARLDGEVHVSVYERVHNNAQSENFLGMFKVQPPRRPNQVIDAWFK
jgi:tRNA (Thr-GGU) A37 N-methylase